LIFQYHRKILGGQTQAPNTSSVLGIILINTLHKFGNCCKLHVANNTLSLVSLSCSRWVQP